jgi:hypothetical protein
LQPSNAKGMREKHKTREKILRRMRVFLIVFRNVLA